MTSNIDSDILLEMRDVRIDGFSDERWHHIIKGVDLTLKRGEVLGLIGESGAGKSTLGLSAMGFVKPGCKIAGGSIVFDGQDLAQMSEREKRQLWGTRITYVAQSAAASFNPAHRLLEQTIEATTRTRLGSPADAPSFNPSQRLMDQTVEASKRAVLNGRLEASVDAVELYRALQLPAPETIGERYPHQVSGGQLQRVMTAMAMSPRPDLIIFDEPTTALDVTTQVEVLAAMRDIVEKFNTAAIYITHDLAVVAQMADKIKVLRYGEEVEESDTATMLRAPKEDYTKSLWSVRSLQKTETESTDILLEIDGVNAAYGDTPVLFDVSVKIPRGKTVAGVGESGSGKSTTARVITGLLPPSKGEVRFHGEALPSSLKARSIEQLQQIQMIYQMADTAMNPRQSVEEIIGRPLELYLGLKGKEKEKRVIELLEMIELDESFMDRLPSELSGGQKQRVCIARALAAEPEVIICDEVTSALDQIVQEGILRLLMRLQEKYGITYLFITHDIATVRAISDEIVVMYQGRVVEQGGKSAVLSPPFPEYTQLLLSSVPEMDPSWLDTLLESRKSA